MAYERRLLISSLVFAAVLSGIAAAEEIGTVAAVNPEMQGTPPEEGKRVLVLGDRLISNERIETTADGSGQLLFLDQTTLTVAPGSDLVLDRYVYDPERDAGEIAVSLTRGALRFIGGRVTKKSVGVVKTPGATIGIRGGMALIEVKNGETRVVNIASDFVELGRSGLDPDDPDRVVLSRPNALAAASAEGVRFEGIVSAKDLAASFRALEGSGSGGLRRISPTLITARAGSRIAAVNSAAAGGAYLEPVSTSGQPVDDPIKRDRFQEDPSARFDNLSTDVSDKIIEPSEPALVQPDPAVIARLRGTATYAGTATGTLSAGSAAARNIAGAFAMTYDFASRSGALSFDIASNRFNLGVAARPGNPANYTGSDPIFGGPDRISAQGGFFIAPNDPRGITAGQFAIDLRSQNQAIRGSYQGDRK